MLDERLLELGGLALPPQALEVAFELASLPFSLQADVVEGAGAESGFPARAQLSVRTASAAAADALLAQLEALLSAHAASPIATVPGSSALKAADVGFGRLFFGRVGDGGELVVSLGSPRPAAPDRDLAGLPAGVEPVLALALDAAKLQGPIERWLASDPEGESLRRQLEWLGLLGEDAAGFALALGHGPDRSHLAFRQRNGVAVASRLGALVREPLTRAELRLIPADATLASIDRHDTRTMLLRTLAWFGAEQGSGPLEELMGFLGIELEPDVLEPLGNAFGCYLSDTTGGGGFPSTVLFHAVEDEARLGLTLAQCSRAIGAWGREQGAGRVRVRTWEQTGTACFSLTFPGWPVPLEPAVAIADGWIFLAATPQALSAAIEHARGDGEGLLAHPALRDAGSLEDLQGLSFLDTERLLRAGYGLATLLATSLANGLRSPSDEARDPGFVLPPYDGLRAGARPSLLFRRIAGEDLLTVGESDRSALAFATGWLGGMQGAVVALGGLATLVIPNVVSRELTSPHARAMADIAAIQNAAHQFAVENGGRYPSSLQDLVEPDQNGLQYLPSESIPRDPWGNPYGYEKPSAQTKLRIFTLGADGAPGGEGENQDFDNFALRR